MLKSASALFRDYRIHIATYFRYSFIYFTFSALQLFAFTWGPSVRTMNQRSQVTNAMTLRIFSEWCSGGSTHMKTPRFSKRQQRRHCMPQGFGHIQTYFIRGSQAKKGKKGRREVLATGWGRDGRGRRDVSF